MHILLLGSGGREHTFAWKLTQSPHCDQLFIAPGNAGTAQLGTNVSINPNDFEAVKAFVLKENIELVIVGPEDPLVNGIWDFFQQDDAIKHIPLIGPSQKGAQLEGSKDFAKGFMQRYSIPTAAYQTFTQDELSIGLEYIATQKPPIVLKADGLAAGKGVLILDDIKEAQREFAQMLDGKFGTASSRVVIEEFLSGIEFSVFVLTDGKDYQLLPVAKDYKRIGEGDTGLNTGGMGSVSPVSFVNEKVMEKVVTRIIEPTLKGIQAEKLTYTGFIFFGLILVNGDPYVIEYNCRMGDPETQTVFPRLKSDLVELVLAAHQNQLAETPVDIDERAAAAVILVSGGYPEAYEKGKVISGFDDVKESLIFHAGTKLNDNEVVTNGGRVLALTSYAENFRDAIAQSLDNATKIEYKGKYYRKDVGFDL